MSKILIDHREDSRIIRELRDFDIEKRQLEIADFIIQGKDSNGIIKNIAIERKTKHDFLNSIIDKRIIKQLSDLRENFDLPLLIIEGTENLYELRNFHPNAIRGMLSAIALDLQIPVIYTRNYKDTASLIQVIAKRLEKSIDPLSLLKKKKPLTLKAQQELIIETFPGIGPLIAKELLKDFGSIKNIVNASEEELQKTNKIGKIKAKKLKEIFSIEYDKP